MTDRPAPCHYLLTSATVWGDPARVLGVYPSEHEAQQAAEKLVQDNLEAAPVRLTVEEWSGAACLATSVGVLGLRGAATTTVLWN